MPERLVEPLLVLVAATAVERTTDSINVAFVRNLSLRVPLPFARSMTSAAGARQEQAAPSRTTRERLAAPIAGMRSPAPTSPFGLLSTRFHGSCTLSRCVVAARAAIATSVSVQVRHAWRSRYGVRERGDPNRKH